MDKKIRSRLRDPVKGSLGGSTAIPIHYGLNFAELSEGLNYEGDLKTPTYFAFYLGPSQPILHFFRRSN
ncbi:hypothetical protein WA026_010357 [Henosepilachna vigintioctopunctata]|uniref:Uncharacterized protein n=1 Tax=Henosepilachna vigintioctopunctata TaxID=420089 RepID=A0AAW1VAV4_9CUCU